MAAGRSDLPLRLASAVADTWRSLGFEQRLAAVGSLLLIVSTFGPFSFVEGAIVLIGVAVLALLRARAQGREFHVPFGDGTMIAAAGMWSGVLILIRLFNRPLGQGLLALVCAAILIFAGLRERAKRMPDDLGPGSERQQRGAGADQALWTNDVETVDPGELWMSGRGGEPQRPPPAARKSARPSPAAPAPPAEQRAKPRPLSAEGRSRAAGRGAEAGAFGEETTLPLGDAGPQPDRLFDDDTVESPPPPGEPPGAVEELTQSLDEPPEFQPRAKADPRFLRRRGRRS